MCQNKFSLLKLFICRLLGLVLCLFSVTQIGCKKMVEIEAPPTSINTENVFASDATAIAAVTGLYAKFASAGLDAGYPNSISLWAGLSSDELTIYSGNTNQRLTDFYQNSLTSLSIGDGSWRYHYNLIYIANAAIENLEKSQTLTPAVKQQLIGEAKFMRAFCYFYLVNEYGDVPLTLTSDYSINAVLARAPKADVWQQIIKDLQEAKTLLSTSFLDATLLKTTAEKVRPNKWAATALLARAYLYTKDWTKAETEATIVIDNSTMFGLSSLNNVFLKNSSEAVWQIQPVNNPSTTDASTFLLPKTGSTIGPSGSHPVYLSPQLLNAFETGDQRKYNWVDSVVAGGITYYFPVKYKTNNTTGTMTEYLMVLRLAEQYLIRAEARAQQSKLSEAIADLNVIRNRAALPNTTSSTKEQILAAIFHERQVELFTEWGHRWFDLIRTGNVDTVMSIVTPLKGGTWNTNWQLYPISAFEIQRDPNLSQNPGY